MVHAFVISRLDYCNVLLSGCTNSAPKHFQLVQNEASRVVTRIKTYEHISPDYWLPITFRIDYKILLLTYKALKGLAPVYLSELPIPYSPPRLLRSQDTGHLNVPRISIITMGGRAFSYRAPILWNNLPKHLWASDTLYL